MIENIISIFWSLFTNGAFYIGFFVGSGLVVSSNLIKNNSDFHYYRDLKKRIEQLEAKYE